MKWEDCGSQQENNFCPPEGNGTKTWSPFLEGHEKLSHRESHSKIFRLINTELPFIQNVSVVHTSQFLDTDELKMALRSQNASGAFEK